MLHPHIFQPGKNIIKHINFSMPRNTHEGTKITIFIIFICFSCTCCGSILSFVSNLIFPSFLVW